MPSKFAHIPEDQIKRYAQAFKLPLLDAYRAIFSQKLLDKIDEGSIEEVLRELVYQIVGEGMKKPPLLKANGVGNVDTAN